MRRHHLYYAPFVMILSYLNSVMTFAQAPHIEYSTYLGGNSWDYGHAITVDDSGYAYIAGQANSSNFPTTPGAFDGSANGGAEIFVTKLNGQGGALVYSTFIGGAGFDDTRKVFVDKSGCAYLTGSTQSANFPTTSNALQGNGEGFFLKLNSLGSSLDYSSRWAGGERILVDGDGYILVLGTTDSSSFPTTENAYSRNPAGGNDVFVAKIDIKTNTIIFSTLIGGSGDEWAPSMAVDSHNNIIIAGQTNSADFPVVGNTFAGYDSGKSNIFITNLKSDGTQLLYSTMIGGSDDEWPFDVAVDQNDDVYVTGVTQSANFPVTSEAFDSIYYGGQDAFLFKLSSDASRLVYSTYVGGTDKDGGRGIVVDKDGKAYITGCTRSTDFPTTQDAFDRSYKGGATDQWAWGDPFLLVMNPEGGHIEYSTYFGGSNDEEAYGIAMDKSGDVYLSGITCSSNFPTTSGSLSRSLRGGGNVYVTKFSFNSQTGIKTGKGLPLKCELKQNFPNPFNPNTIISYGLPVASTLSLKVYDILGQEVATLFEGIRQAGAYDVMFDGSRLASGIYFYRLLANAVSVEHAGSFVETRKLVLLK
jgi:hypothetical protein